MEFHQLRTENLDSLRSRAHEYFRSVNRPVPSRELARALFHTDAPDDHVSPLLIRTLLRRDERFAETERGTWDLLGARYHDVRLENVRFTVVDLEATGSNPDRDQVIEVGVVVIEGLEIVDRFSTLVQPEVRIPDWIQRLTGIDEAKVQDAPRFHQVAPTIEGLLEGSVFVAHNVDFDERFLRTKMESCGLAPEPWPSLCTVRLTRRVMRGMPSYRLNALADRLGIALAHHHRAVDDAEAAARIFLHVVHERLRPADVRTVGELLAHGRRPAQVRRERERRRAAT